MSANGSRTLRLLLADDDPSIRRGVRIILEHEGFDMVAEAADGHDAVQLCRELQPDVVVLDISMPRLNGIAAARQIASTCRDVKIVILTSHCEEQYVEESLRAGATGYVVKNKIASALQQAIEAVCRGERYISEGIEPLSSAPWSFGSAWH